MDKVAFALIGFFTGAAIALVIRIPWLPPLGDSFFQFCSTVATVAGSIGGAYLLWDWQQKRRALNVDASFKEVFRYVAAQASLAKSTCMEESFLRMYPAAEILARWDRRSRPTRAGNNGYYYLDDDELILCEMMIATRAHCVELLPLIKRALSDYQSLKSQIVELLPQRQSQLVHLEKIVVDSQRDIQACAEAQEDPVRWDQSNARPTIELLADALSAWMEDRVFGFSSEFKKPTSSK